jgi:hypothetical protein
MPTAHSLAAPGNVDADSAGPKMAPPVSSVQAVPFQRRISARKPPQLAQGSTDPTAYTSVAERAAIPVTLKLGSPLRLGLGTMCHDVPSQCSISVPLVKSVPAAQASVGEMAVTAAICVPAPKGPGAGCAIGTTVQAVPLKWSA